MKKCCYCHRKIEYPSTEEKDTYILCQECTSLVHDGFLKTEDVYFYVEMIGVSKRRRAVKCCYCHAKIEKIKYALPGSSLPGKYKRNPICEDCAELKFLIWESARRD